MNFIKMIAITIILLLTGCSNSDLEKENAKLHEKLTNVKRYNTQLETKLSRLNNLEKELNNIKKNNKDLSVTLAKSEVEFSKKYKKELQEKEELLKSERFKIESNAQLLAEENAKNKYMIIIASLVFFFISFIGFTFYKRNEYSQKNLKYEINIEKLDKTINELNQRLEEQKKYTINLEDKIKEMEVKEKETSINQVVSKINENELHRNKSLQRIEKELVNV